MVQPALTGELARTGSLYLAGGMACLSHSLAITPTSVHAEVMFRSASWGSAQRPGPGSPNQATATPATRSSRSDRPRTPSARSGIPRSNAISGPSWTSPAATRRAGLGGRPADGRPAAGRHWALPVLTVLAPSSRYYQQLGRRHKKVTDRARQMVMLLRRWLPQRPLVLVGDNGCAVLDLLHCCQSLREPVTLIARLRLDAALYAPAPARQPGQNGRPALKGPRRPPLKMLLGLADVTWNSVEVAWYDGATRIVELTSQTAVWYRSGKPPVTIRWVLIRDPQNTFESQALLCTYPAADPTQILEWFVLRWQLEVTFQEVRTHLGVETQRQWSDLAIARTTPVLLGLFSWTTLAAHALQKRHPMTQRKAAWYDKPSPTFVDAIALVRRHLWLASEGFSLSVADPDTQELPVALYHRLVDSLAYAA